MKLLLGMVTIGVLAAAAFLSPGSAAPPPRITWDGDLATISWAEPLADPAAGPDEVSFSILTGPYIGWLTDTRAVIGWEVVARKGWTDPFQGVPANYDVKNFQFRSITLDGLKPGTAYRYRLTSSNGKYQYAGREYRFRTLPGAVATKLRFAVIGDTQRFAQQPWKDINTNLYRNMQQWNPNLVLHVGDLVMNGWGEGVNGRKEWFRLFGLMRDLRATHWLAPAMGNHDVFVGKTNPGPDYFRDLPAVENQAGKAQPPFYYSFDVANVHFIALSTEQRRDGPKKQDLSETKVFNRFTWKEQVAWLEADLRANRKPWTVAFFHQPLHTAGGYPCRPEFHQDMGRLFDQYKVPIVFSGHDHSYQRTWRIHNGTRQRADNGTVQVISGGASNQHKKARSPDWNLFYVRVYHYLRVEIDGERLHVDAVREDGSVLESWEMKTTGQPVVLKELPAELPEPRVR